MRRSPRPVVASATLAVALLGFPAGASRADAPAVQEWRTQRVGRTTYFRVRFRPPAGLRLPQLGERVNWWQTSRPVLNRLPRLVPQDDKTAAVYLRLTFPDDPRGQN